MIPLIPQNQIIMTESILQDQEYKGLRIIRCQADPIARENFSQIRYQFQHQPADYTPISVTLTRKGAKNTYRLVAYTNPTLKLLTEIVKYDPANPPPDNYQAKGMKQAHDQTQSDFKGQKKANAEDFRNYILEGIRGARTLYLPVISGWQSTKDFDRTVFVAFDENDPNAMYGTLYLPKSPIMQADGQTQTAALFAIAKTIDVIESGGLDTLTLTLEIELNVKEYEAAQSFADRNGRGTKKNRNLVIGFDTSSALSRLRIKAVEGTVFEQRLADGRSTGTSETATKDIVDLSTMEQMLLSVVSGGSHKPEHFKHHHIDPFLPYAKDFLQMLDRLFAKQWPHPSPTNQDPFRRLYVHGWPFALKGIALAYHSAHIDKLGPMSQAIGTEAEDHDAGKTVTDKFLSQIEAKKAKFDRQPVISPDELEERLSKIDWLRYRAHWIKITGSAVKDGKKKTFKLKSSGEVKVVALAQNVPTTINTVRDKILSDKWKDLCAKQDESVTS